MDYRILPPEELIEEGAVELPLSKSMLNRLIVIEALSAEGPSFRNAASAPTTGEGCDIALMRDAVNALMSSVPGQTEINIGESGTGLRFLCALSAVLPGHDTIITGEPGLLKRPVAPLVDALRLCGAEIEYLGTEGHAPLRISGKKLSGGEITIDATVSSQFVSALMMTAPLMENGLKINFDGEPASLPYIKMTAEIMKRHGAKVELAPLSAEIKPGSYVPEQGESTLEADWSAAAFWYEVVALTAGWITLGCRGGALPLPTESIQGDSQAMRFFECLGVLTEPAEDEPGSLALSPSPELFGRLDLDLNGYPDLAPALAVTCCMLGVPFRFTGLKSLAIKETDRLQAIVEEMEKIGCTVEKIRDYGLEWEGKRHPITEMPVFDPRGDHRLAMAFAPVAAYIPGIVVKDAGCVGKSYPGYWDSLRSLGFVTLDPAEPVPGHEDKEEEEE